MVVKTIDNTHEVQHNSHPTFTKPYIMVVRKCENLKSKATARNWNNDVGVYYLFFFEVVD